MRLASLALGAAAAAVAGMAITTATAQPTDDPALRAALMSQGQTIYARDCAVCHGGNGAGGLGPAFIESPALASLSLIMDQIIRGGAYMPPFGQFSDEQVAAIATFIRNSFGNSFSVVAPETVAAYR